MRPQDLKRLIAGFLVFSAIASTATLISFNFIGSSKSNEQALDVEGEGGQNPLSTISKNAFVEKLPAPSNGNINSGFSQTVNGAAIPDSSNLTKNMAGVFAGQMITNNPNGPQLDKDGNPTVLNLPGEDKAAEMIKKALSQTAISFDDNVSVSKDKIAKSFSPDDISKYINQVYEILGQVSSSTKNSISSGQTPTADDLILPSLAIDAAFSKLSSLSVPNPFIEVHTNLLRLFANQKNVFYAATNYQSDPMKAMLAVQNEKEIINRDLARVKNAALKVDPKSLSLDNRPEWQKLYSEFFGVKKAYANLLVFDPSAFGNTLATVSNLTSSYLGRITEWLYTTALRVAVNILINEFQNQVVNWIAGNGKPKFITNWRGFINDVANKAAGQAIYSILPQVCSGLGPFLRVALLPVPTANYGIRCTLNQVVNNVDRFFNNFQTGGWVAYGAALQPQNNLFGVLLLANDIVIQKTAEETAAANSQALAYRGYLSVTKCTQYTLDENGFETTTCEPGHEVATTPGAAVADALATSFGWKGQQIAYAQRFEDLVAAIVNASINRIIKEGLSSLTEARNPPPPSFNNATPGGVNNPGYAGGTKTSVINLINSLDQAGVFQKNQDVITADTQWLSLALSSSSQPQATTSAMTALNQLSGSCSSMSGLISQRKNEINSLASTVITELGNANNIKNLKTAAPAATSTQDISNIVSQLQTIDIGIIFSTATTAQNRLSSLQTFIAAVQDNIQNGCSGSLPPITTP